MLAGPICPKGFEYLQGMCFRSMVNSTSDNTTEVCLKETRGTGQLFPGASKVRTYLCISCTIMETSLNESTFQDKLSILMELLDEVYDGMDAKPSAQFYHNLTTEIESM